MATASTCAMTRCLQYDSRETLESLCDLSSQRGLNHARLAATKIKYHIIILACTVVPRRGNGAMHEQV